MRAKEFRSSQIIFQLAGRYLNRLFPSLDDLPRRFAADLSQSPLQLAHSGFPRILRDDSADNARAEGQRLIIQSVFPPLARQEVALSDFQLFLLRIARKRENLQPITQRPGNPSQIVGRNDPEYLRQIKGKIHVPIAECVVLRRIKNL